MVAVGEVVFLIVCLALGTRWYLRTPMHKGRKRSGVFPSQVAGYMGFGMYSRNEPAAPPHALHDHRQKSEDEQQ
jgi:hypothetical protein